MKPLLKFISAMLLFAFSKAAHCEALRLLQTIALPGVAG